MQKEGEEEIISNLSSKINTPSTTGTTTPLQFFMELEEPSPKKEKIEIKKLLNYSDDFFKNEVETDKLPSWFNDEVAKLPKQYMSFMRVSDNEKRAGTVAEALIMKNKE